MQKWIHKPKVALSGINESDPGQDISDSQHSTSTPRRVVKPLSHIRQKNN